MRVARRQGIKGAVLEHVCGRASVPMDLSGGAVRLRAAPHGLPTRAQVSAALRRQSGGYHAGTPPSLDPTCSPPSLPNACRTLDASARAGSAVWLCGGLQIVVRAPTAGHATTPTPAQRLRDGGLDSRGVGARWVLGRSKLGTKTWRIGWFIGVVRRRRLDHWRWLARRVAPTRPVGGT